MEGLGDVHAGRKGEWQQTSLGGRFYPADPREEEVFMSDIANGLALDCRYSGQGRTDRFYSVAEHSVHMARYALQNWPQGDGFPQAVLATLLHDAPEAYLNDLSRAVKHAVGAAYNDLEDGIQAVILRKYNLITAWRRNAGAIKDLDRRMVPLEKAAIMRHPQPWAFDQFKPLENVRIECWTPAKAKREFLIMYLICCELAGATPEAVVYE